MLKYIKHNFKFVSFGLVNHNARLYKFIDFNSSKKQSLYSYAAHIDERSKLWDERLGHLNYDKNENDV